MLSSVVKLSKGSNIPNEQHYLEDIIKVIMDMPSYYTYEHAESNSEVKEHLREIVDYREQVRQSYW